MSPSVVLDDDVFDFLKSKAEPFVDTPSSVLRRLLGIDEVVNQATASARTDVSIATLGRAKPSGKSTSRGKKRKTTKASPIRTRAASGTLLPEEKYERPLLKALVDAGGHAPYRDVVDAVGRELKGQLMPADFENLTSGAVRWQSRLQFVRLRLIERGYLDKNSPRGVWGITEAGRDALADQERS